MEEFDQARHTLLFKHTYKVSHLIEVFSLSLFFSFKTSDTLLTEGVIYYCSSSESIMTVCFKTCEKQHGQGVAHRLFKMKDLGHLDVILPAQVNDQFFSLSTSELH